MSPDWSIFLNVLINSANPDKIRFFKFSRETSIINLSRAVQSIHCLQSAIFPIFLHVESNKFCTARDKLVIERGNRSIWYLC